MATLIFSSSIKTVTDLYYILHIHPAFQRFIIMGQKSSKNKKESRGSCFPPPPVLHHENEGLLRNSRFADQNIRNRKGRKAHPDKEANVNHGEDEFDEEFDTSSLVEMDTVCLALDPSEERKREMARKMAKENEDQILEKKSESNPNPEPTLVAIVPHSMHKLDRIARGKLQPFPDMLGFKMVNFVSGDEEKSFSVKAVLWLQIPLGNNRFYMDGDRNNRINMARMTPQKDHKYCCYRATVIGVQFLGNPKRLKQACLAYQRNQGYLQSIQDEKFHYEVEEEVRDPDIGKPGWGCCRGIYFYYNFETACGHEQWAEYPLITARFSGRRRRVKPYQKKISQSRVVVSNAPIPQENRIVSHNRGAPSDKSMLGELCDQRTGIQRFFNQAAPLSVEEMVMHCKVVE
jgi:hypothetical protein